MKNFLTKTRGNFHHNFKEPQKGKYILWILIAFFVLFVAKDLLGGVGATVANGAYMVRHYFLTSGATIPVFIRSRIELLEQIQNFEQELASQKGDEATLAYIIEDNEELRQLLFASSSPRTVAGVIARPPYTPYDTVVIDKGSEDGVVKNAPVYHGKGIALGYVRSVFPHSSLITLFSSPGVETTVYVFGANIFTTAYGEGGGVVRISVPQGIVLEKGKPVILPSLDTGVLGTIGEIQSIPTEPEQHAYVTLGAPLQSIRLVTVGKYPVEQTSFSEAMESVEEAEKTLFKIEVPEESRVYTPPSVGTSTATTTRSQSTSTLP